MFYELSCYGWYGSKQNIELALWHLVRDWLGGVFGWE